MLNRQHKSITTGYAAHAEKLIRGGDSDACHYGSSRVVGASPPGNNAILIDFLCCSGGCWRAPIGWFLISALPSLRPLLHGGELPRFGQVEQRRSISF